MRSLSLKKNKGRDIRKMLVANRGEIALRIIAACKELGIGTIAIHAPDDKNKLIERSADEYVNMPGRSMNSTYLNIRNIVRIAKKRGADAIHPGYGFLAENPLMARACESGGIEFIGPSSTALEKVADKICARDMARSTGMQVIPGSGVLNTKEEALDFARQQGYPMLIKSCMGGGGRGIRIVNNSKELLRCFDNAAAEALTSFGSPRIYAEQCLKARHVEFQFLADKHGNAVHLFDRECSIQRRFQKLVEEAPSQALTGKTRQKIGNRICALARSIKYAGAGTAEFLITPEKRIYFLEVNPRIQVEHGVTEMITGIDIVKEQIRIAQGLPLSVKQEDVRTLGHAIECRIVAESARRNFAPAGGIIRKLALKDAGNPCKVRIDTAAYQGMRVNPAYDSLLAKLIVWGMSRKDAIRHLRKALDSIRIEGVQNTINLYRFLAKQKSFVNGKLSTTFIKDNKIIERYTKHTLTPETAALIAAAIYDHETHHSISFKRDKWVENTRKEAAGIETDES
jgi:acetyl-CoA carboxylase, biotin carboxylase subunit